MIFDKARMAKLSGLMTEGKGGIKDPMADNFGGGDVEGDPWLDGEVTTEGAHDDEGTMPGGSMDEEEVVREMIRTEMRKAKKDMDKEKQEEETVREAVRQEIRSVLRSRGVAMGGLGWGFKR